MGRAIRACSPIQLTCQDTISAQGGAGKPRNPIDDGGVSKVRVLSARGFQYSNPPLVKIGVIFGAYYCEFCSPAFKLQLSGLTWGAYELSLLFGREGAL